MQFEKNTVNGRMRKP